MEPKEISSRLIPRPLVVFTRLLEILVTTLISYFHHLLVSNRPIYWYSGHIEFIKSEEYYGMPRVHLLSIYERFLDKKAIIIASKHGTMTFLSITIIF